MMFSCQCAALKTDNDERECNVVLWRSLTPLTVSFNYSYTKEILEEELKRVHRGLVVL